MECSSWSTRFGVGRGANDPTSEKFTVMKPWRRPKSTRGCSVSKKEEEAGNVRERNMVLESFIFLSKRMCGIDYLIGSCRINNVM
jgi:hypothetical protein